MSAENKNLKLAIVGTGIFATDMHLPTLDKFPNLTPTACYNRTKAKAETFAAKAKIDPSQIYESLEDIIETDSVDFVDALFLNF